MRRLHGFILLMCLLTPLRSVFAQSLNDFVKRIEGDTLVVKDYADMNGKANSLYEVLVLDSGNAPAGRVYELQAGGWYPLDTMVHTSSQHPTVIVGSDPTVLVNNRNAASSPPLITGYVEPNAFIGGVTAQGDLTIKNCAFVVAAADGTLGWNFVSTAAANLHLVFDNNLFERTRSVFVTVSNPDCDVTFRNCYFVNMNGQPCRRNGGVFDCVANLDTLLVENCTHINAQGSLYRFRILPVPYRFTRIVINHNTFINCAGYAFMNPGYQNNFSLTNNVFINCNIQPYPGSPAMDVGEQDPDWLPMGLVNVYPDSADNAKATQRTFLVQSNLAYWDPYFDDVVPLLNHYGLDGIHTWRSQMLVANARTDSMFRHLGRFNTTQYLHLVTDSWKNALPTFTAPQNLFDSSSSGTLSSLRVFAIEAVDTGAGAGPAILRDWRLVNIGPVEYIHPDWPIPVDLSYSDANLTAAGIGGFPLGDLNWFPAQKATWMAQRDAEYAQIQSRLDQGRLEGIKEARGSVPGEFRLDQNYPNPFNPTTEIRFQASGVRDIRLVVYDLLGRKVAVLANGRYPEGEHTFTFDGTNLASGPYFYHLTTGTYSAVRKMLLVR